jgi:hypothetical protein
MLLLRVDGACGAPGACHVNERSGESGDLRRWTLIPKQTLECRETRGQLTGEEHALQI